MEKQVDVENLDQRFRLLIAKYVRLESEHFKKNGLQHLTGADIRAVHHIGQRQKERMTNLANHLRLTVGTLTTTVDRLVQKELVLRQHLEEDRRVVEVRLSDKGTEAFEQIEKSKKILAENIFGRLNEEEIATFNRIMVKLID